MLTYLKCDLNVELNISELYDQKFYEIQTSLVIFFIQIDPNIEILLDKIL